LIYYVSFEAYLYYVEHKYISQIVNVNSTRINYNESRFVVIENKILTYK